MFGFLKRLRRRSGGRTDPLPKPFPDVWNRILQDDVPFFRRLPSNDDRAQLGRDVFRFIADKRWTPFDIEIDDQKKVVIAAFACLLINRRLDLGIFPRTREIIVRPGAFADVHARWESDGSIVETGNVHIGEAWYRGPVVLAWDAIEPLTSRRTSAPNVIVHEFAHKLDFLDGYADGTPPLAHEDLQQWVDTLSPEFDGLRNAVAKGKSTTIDPYGAVDESEFFAVISESFFSRPRQLQRRHANLYEQLKRFYLQDPVAWPRASSI